MEKAKTGYGKPGAIAKIKPHLGHRLLRKYGGRISCGFDDLEKFELVDRLQKPVLNFSFYGNKKVIVDIYDFLSEFPYAYIVQTRLGGDIWRLPAKGVRYAEVYISRFPKLIRFIAEHEDAIPDDLWGLLFGYPAAEAHLFTYDHIGLWRPCRPSRSQAGRAGIKEAERPAELQT